MKFLLYTMGDDSQPTPPPSPEKMAEAKELVGGFALIEVGSKEEAIEWAKRFRSVEGDGVSYIRRVYGPDDGPGGPA